MVIKKLDDLRPNGLLAGYFDTLGSASCYVDHVAELRMIERLNGLRQIVRLGTMALRDMRTWSVATSHSMAAVRKLSSV